MSIAADPSRLGPAEVMAALHDVPDPEIPAVSVVDLGVIGRIEVEPDRIRVAVLPTFVGCPAIEPMRAAIAARLRRLAPGRAIEVELSFAEPWTSDRITPEGRRRLVASGFGAPLPAGRVDRPLELEAPVPCPFCGSQRTVLENAFGPTPCRSIRYCTACSQPFEQFKDI